MHIQKEMATDLIVVKVSISAESYKNWTNVLLVTLRVLDGMKKSFRTWVPLGSRHSLFLIFIFYLRLSSCRSVQFWMLWNNIFFFLLVAASRGSFEPGGACRGITGWSVTSFPPLTSPDDPVLPEGTRHKLVTKLVPEENNNNDEMKLRSLLRTREATLHEPSVTTYPGKIIHPSALSYRWTFRIGDLKSWHLTGHASSRKL